MVPSHPLVWGARTLVLFYTHPGRFRLPLEPTVGAGDLMMKMIGHNERFGSFLAPRASWPASPSADGSVGVHPEVSTDF